MLRYQRSYVTHEFMWDDLFFVWVYIYVYNIYIYYVYIFILPFNAVCIRKNDMAVLYVLWMTWQVSPWSEIVFCFYRLTKRFNWCKWVIWIYLVHWMTEWRQQTQYSKFLWLVRLSKDFVEFAPTLRRNYCETSFLTLTKKNMIDWCLWNACHPSWAALHLIHTKWRIHSRELILHSYGKRKSSSQPWEGLNFVPTSGSMPMLGNRS